LYNKAASYSPQFNNEEKAFALQDLQEVIGFLAHMDKGFANSSVTIHFLINDYQHESRNSAEDINAVCMHIETLASSLGTCPPTLGAKYEAPLVWGLVGQLAITIEGILMNCMLRTHSLSLQMQGQFLKMDLPRRQNCALRGVQQAAPQLQDQFHQPPYMIRRSQSPFQNQVGIGS
jgi:hypothetical protein